MTGNEIIHKLGEFIHRHSPLTEEAHVVYLMVEIRKAMDQEGTTAQFPILKFYADWTLHSRKNGITPEIKAISEEMYDAARQSIAAKTTVDENSPIAAFANMTALRRDVSQFLQHNPLDGSLAGHDDNWGAFVQLLAAVLADQPIEKPSKNVEAIRFEPADSRCTVMTLSFEQPIDGHDHYSFKNPY